MKIMAVDLGLVRTGLAISDELELLASPIGTVTERDLNVLASKIAAAADAHGAGALVVGLPRNMDGSKGESAERAEAFAEQLRTLTGLPVSLWDERLTTVSAIGYLNETNVRGKKRKAIVDTVSATIILEDYLKSRR
ncbi:MAG: Holliday junction resolvase RuvX [Clostridia bacterium]|nr:Holliday junction resolvase RuvX [Clostridia bacterium]